VASVGKPRRLALGLLALLILRKPNPRFRQFGGHAGDTDEANRFRQSEGKFYAPISKG
jgi:hypothetical protein